MMNMPFAYTIKRSSRKTLAVEITREATVLVRAPNRASRRAIETFIKAHEGWIMAKLSAAQVHLQAHPPATEEEIALLRERAQACLPLRVAHFSRLMGVFPTGVTITKARTRFGSCSPKNRICFSCFLMQYPEEAIDYVVVHELAHILHKDHSPAFHNAVAQILPDHKARRALLKRM